MDVGSIDPFFVAVLSTLVAVAVVSAIAVVAVLAMAVTTCGLAPVMVGLAARRRRRIWRAWHPPTSWLPDLDEPFEQDPVRSPVRALAVASSRDAGGLVQIITGKVAAAAPGHGGTYAPTTLVHARLAPYERLDLPPRPGSPVAVYVLAGQGALGAARHPVYAGQVAVLEPGDPVCIVAEAGPASSPLEVLVLGELAAAGRSVSGIGPTVLDGAEIQRRLRGLQELTTDLADSGGDQTPPSPGELSRVA